MWGRKDDPKETPPAEPSRTPEGQPPITTAQRAPESRPTRPPSAEPARLSGSHIGKSIQFKGEISGKEDLLVDGVVEGKVELDGADLQVGQTGTIRADATARTVLIEGALHGNLKASDKIEIRKTGSLEGDIVTVGISIQEGAVFRGSVDIVKRGQISAEGSPARKNVSSETAARPESKGERPGPKAAGAGSR